MKCPTTTNSTPKINKNKRIGTVVIFLEGEQTEMKIFEKIFCDILGYKAVSIKRRGRKTFTCVRNLKPDVSNTANIFLFNLRKPQIKTISDNEFRDNLYKEALSVYGIDLKNKPVYYIWDRDYDSNLAKDVEELVQRLGSANGNTIDNPRQDYENGLLLLSYPAIESYIISHLKPVKTVPTNTSLKKYLKTKKLKIKDFNEMGLSKAIKSMHERMSELGVFEYDTDNFSNTHSSVLEKEDQSYIDAGCYLILSLISIIFIDLGIIELQET